MYLVKGWGVLLLSHPGDIPYHRVRVRTGLIVCGQLINGSIKNQPAGFLFMLSVVR